MDPAHVKSDWSDQKTAKYIIEKYESSHRPVVKALQAGISPQTKTFKTTELRN